VAFGRVDIEVVLKLLIVRKIEIMIEDDLEKVQLCRV